MNTISFSATPVAAFFRRLVNIFSLSAVSELYLHTNRREEPWGAFALYNGARRSLSNFANSQTPLLDGATLSQMPIPPRSDEPPKDRSKIPPSPKSEQAANTDDIIHRLMSNPVLYNPLRAPRYPIVLCHGLYGFDVRGPSSFPRLQMHYWSNVLSILRKRVGADVIVTSVPATGSVTSRAQGLHRALAEKAQGRAINFMAHSMGGLDCRYLISTIKPTEYVPISLTTISTPHRGSPFMDWCSENIGLGRLQREQLLDAVLSDSTNSTTTTTTTIDRTSSGQTETERKVESTVSSSLAALPSSFTTFLLSILDSPAYANLTSVYLNDVFNPATPDDPNVRYFSVAGRTQSVNVWHPFWLPQMVIDAWEKKERARLRAAGGAARADAMAPPLWERDSEWGNDGLVTVQSAKWGEFLGTIEGADHWEIRGARGIELDIDIPSLQSVSISLPSIGAGSVREWDWMRFLTGWRKDGKEQGNGGRESRAGVQMKAENGVLETRGEKPDPASAQKDKDDDVLQASTEKLSAVFDWIVDHVPTEPVKKAVGASSAQEVEATAQGTKRRGERNELATKDDLERFYVALSRKLYDEGL